MRVTGEVFVTDIDTVSGQAIAPVNDAHIPKTFTRAIATAPEPQQELAPHVLTPGPARRAIVRWRVAAVAGRITFILTGMAMFTGKQTRVGRKDPVIAGARRMAVGPVHSNETGNNRHQRPSNAPHNRETTMTLTEVPMREHTEISGPAIIVRLLAHAGEGAGADKPRYW